MAAEKKAATRPVRATQAEIASAELPCSCPDNCFQCDIGNHYQCRDCARLL